MGKMMDKGHNVNGAGGPSRKGFTFLEVTIAAALLAFCVVPILTFSQRGIFEADQLREEIAARHELMNMCEDLKFATPQQLTAYATTLGQSGTTGQAVRPTQEVANRNLNVVGLQLYQRSIEFEKNMDGEVGLHRVTMKVKWTSRRGRPASVSLSRLIHNHDS